MDFVLDDLPFGESEMLKSPSTIESMPLIISQNWEPQCLVQTCVCSKLMCLHLLCFLLCCFPSSFETGSSASNSLFAWGCSWTQVYSLCLPSVSVTDDYRYASPYLYLLYFLHGLFPLLKCRGCLYLFWIILGPSWFYHIKMPMPTGFELSLALVN